MMKNTFLVIDSLPVICVEEGEKYRKVFFLALGKGVLISG